ncbi:MAG: prepilin-type N-terminal cleavage/methylation domain-containing protein [Proteobacteria bacterium]|nr:prepilin-type N-terminal cleavage/methylation domain-containing protein [Pseudomonadota bacterium]
MHGSHGFSLIELMVVVAIAGILAAVALPAYSKYMMESKLKTAQIALLNTASTLRQFAQDKNTYVGGCSVPATATDFQLACTATSVTSYVLQATGNGAMAGFVLTLDQNGNKATPNVPSGWTLNTACWVSDSAGDCTQGQ